MVTNKRGGKNFLDLQGKIFGRLKVIRRAKNNKNGQSRWLCECSCGNRKIVRSDHLIGDKIRSCGCLRKETTGKQFFIHGQTDTRLFKVWTNMIKRCHNSRSSDYKNYGQRGITVCDEWRKSFKEFYEWSMANGYAPGLTIERKDNNGNYSPDNCKWATKVDQGNNKRNNILVIFNGKTQTIAQWTREFGMTYHEMYWRVRVRHISLEIIQKEMRAKGVYNNVKSA